jgi:hypothetical protein
LNGRCNLHGGKSLAWFAHPNFKHGLYSKYAPQGIWLAAQRRRKRKARKENAEFTPP